MSEKRKTKKSESIEVRLPWETRRAFMARCRGQGRTASDVVRGFIEQYLAEPSSREVRKMPRFIKPDAAAAGTAAVAALFALAPAVSASDLEAAFKALDLNGDGVVTVEEFTSAPRAGMAHHGGKAHGGAKPAPLPMGIAAHDPKHGAPTPEMLRTHFAKLDTDKSGQLSLAEFAEHYREMMHAAFASIDGDGDGGIDSAELGKAAAKIGHHAPGFGELDADKNGRIGFDEFAKAHEG